MSIILLTILMFFIAVGYWLLIILTIPIDYCYHYDYYDYHYYSCCYYSYWYFYFCFGETWVCMLTDSPNWGCQLPSPAYWNVRQPDWCPTHLRLPENSLPRHWKDDLYMGNLRTLEHHIQLIFQDAVNVGTAVFFFFGCLKKFVWPGWHRFSIHQKVCEYDDTLAIFVGRLLLTGSSLVGLVFVFLCVNGHFMGQEGFPQAAGGGHRNIYI